MKVLTKSQEWNKSIKCATIFGGMKYKTNIRETARIIGALK